MESWGSRLRRGALATAVVAALVTSAALIAPTSGASAAVPTAQAPLLQPDESVVTADPLPTVQIDSGYVWAQTVIGNTVYSAGSFSNARAALANPGTNLTPRSNILAFDITTGALLPFAPQVNGVIKAVAASPDGSRIYIGGSFSQVNGSPRWGIAALNAQTGELISNFTSSIGGTGVFGLAVTADSVYAVGSFTQANGVARKNLAAFATSNGALRSWAPTTDLQADAVVLDPSGDRIVVAGRFYRVNDVVQRGLVSLDLTTGSIDTGWQTSKTIVNGWNSGSDAGKAGIFTLAADAGGVYGTGWSFAPAAVGNLEGTFAAEAGSGAIRWVADCHGDHYGVYSTGETVYSTSHTHSCETVNLWPEQSPRAYRYIEAYTASAEGTLTRTQSAGTGYKDWSGTPSPSAYAWYPDFTVGTSSGLGQAGLSITGAGDFIAVAGEFTSVNNQRYQGIVRFSTNPSTGAKSGPRIASATWAVPQASSSAPGRVQVTIPTNWDRDDRDLTYQLLRDGSPTPVDERVAPSGWWTRDTVVLADRGLVPDSRPVYTVRAVDPDGNSVTSRPVTATVGSGTSSDYANLVLDDRASLYYPLGSISTDWAGSNPRVDGFSVSTTSPGAVVGATGSQASDYSGSSSSRTSTKNATTATNTFSTELWFKTNTTRGGKLIGFGSSQTGSSSSYDRHVYMQNNGRLTFGVYPGSVKTVSSTAAYNDNAWHHVVATQGAEGIALYVDGKLVAQDAAITGGAIFNGYWRIGGDTISSWPSAPSSAYFDGAIDEVAVYPAPLNAGQVMTHFAVGRGLEAPTAAFTSAVTDLSVAFDGSASAGAAGATIASYSWNFGDGSAAATGATATHAYATPGTYPATLTVVDNQGVSSAVTQQIVVQAANVLPTASFTSTVNGLSATVNGGASADADGTIAEHSWNWGDGTPDSTGATATHAYGAAGDYTVTLTVKDDRGGVATTTNAVTVTHAAPVADFVTAGAQMDVSVDASASSASDGATLAYEWNWGDDSALGSGATAQHTYAAAGTYTVTLRITDSFGATNTTTRTVTVANVAFAIRDDFERSASNGWGVAEVGGAYSAMYGAVAAASVGDGRGVVTLPAGQTRNMALRTTALSDTLATMSFSINTAPNTGGSYVGLSARQSATADYLTRVWLRTDGTLWLVVQRSGTVIATQPLSTTWAAGEDLRLKVEVTGSSPTTIRAKTWKASGSEPASWQITTTDSTAGLQGSGWTSVHAARGGAATSPAAFSFDTLRVVDPAAAEGPVNVAPVAAFTPAATGLSVAVDGAASTDADGTIASHSWNWGDGSAAGSGATATHTYAAAGTYAVTLTVTDDKGATATSTAQVTVSVPPVDPVNAAPVAAFTSTVAAQTVTVDGAGSSDADGTIASHSWNWGDGSAAGTGASASHTYAAPGTYAVTLTVVDNLGATATHTADVVIADAGPVDPAAASDDFTRTVASGWGNAVAGGAWTVLYGAASAASVSGDAGKVSLAPGNTRNMMLNTTSLRNVQMSMDFSLDAAPSTGSAYAGLVARASATDNYTVRSWLNGNGSVWIVIQRGSTVLNSYIVPGVTRAAGDTFTLKAEVSGGAATVVSAKLWRTGTPEPATWQVSATDATALDASGTVGVHTARSGPATSTAVVTVDNFLVTALG